MTTAVCWAIERVVPSDDAQQRSLDVERLVKSTDIEMLAVVGGRERTAAEYGDLYRQPASS